MIWPPPNDFRDAVRNPAASFRDPDLVACDAVVGADGLPEAHPGNAARVYQLCAEDGRSWAVKCFARIDDSRQERYAAVRAAFAGKPFAVPFDYLPDGARIAGRRWPVLKVEWVEGPTLWQVAKERANSPAVMDGLFKRWVQLARELRTAGVAHGDLQHANVLLVPGKWPGSYTLKLIDYDAVYLPELADRPTYETGSPNYQHPERNERSYSPDLDRFPLLVVATALRALAVRGPDLWRAYAARDGLLFTASDFGNPGASRVMRKLWKNADPALRGLVGHLVLACGRPLAETPWLDDLCANGAPALTDDETRTVDATLPAPVSVGEFTLDGEDADLIPATVVAFTLDDEPEPPAPKSKPVVEGKAAKPAPARPKPLTPVPVVTDGDDEDDEPQPRRKSRREPAPARGFPWIAVAVLLGFMMVAGAVVAGWLAARYGKPAEAAQVQPQPNDAPKPQPNPPTPTPAPAPPKPAPVPPEPAFAGPPGYHRVWAKPFNPLADVRLFFAADGQTVYVAPAGRIDAFDAKTGDPRPGLRGQVPQLTLGLWALPGDRVAAFGFPQRAPRLWDAKTGDPLPFLARDPLPPPPPGVPAGPSECRISPDGRYLFVAYQGPFQNGMHAPAPFRVVEVSTGNAVASGDWAFGAAAFAGDRLLLAESNGRVRWIDLKTGSSEVEWAFTPGMPWLRGAAADGSLFVYFGRPAGLAFDSYLIDGKTGQPLRRVGPNFLSDFAVLSPDGRHLAGIVNEPPQFTSRAVVLTDARTGEVLVRTPIDGAVNDFERVSFTPDGRKFVVHHRGRNELQVYELRGAVPAGAAEAPTPVGPVPPRAGPGAFAAVPVPPGGPPLPPGPGPGPPDNLPAAPALALRWKGVAAAPMANQLPQAPLFTADGKTLVLSGGTSGTVLTFDAKTGKAGAVFDGHKGPGGVLWLAVAGNDRVASGGFDAKQATWDIKTGQPVDAVKFPELPPLPPGAAGHAGLTYGVSPGGRYTVLARREARGGPVVDPGPLRVLDTTTGKEVLSGEWNGGRVVFTADESRVLVLNGLGKAAWYKLPSGEADGGWEIGTKIQAERARVLGVSADGEKVLYQGALAGQPSGVYLLEGRTGRVLRRLNSAPPHQMAISTLSPDGRHVAVGVMDFARNGQWHVDVFEADGWRVVGRASSPDRGGVREVPQFAFTPDGKGLGVLFPVTKELLMFGLPDR